MGDCVRIQMMDTFTIYINEIQADRMVNKSRKGVALMQYLILNREQPVPNQRLLAALWSEEKSANPENALKTLVSRLRALLNQLSPGLGQAIVADRNAYHWQLLPGMSVDVYEIEDIFAALSGHNGDIAWHKEQYARLMKLYSGDLLQNGPRRDGPIPGTAPLPSTGTGQAIWRLGLLFFSGTLRREYLCFYQKGRFPCR